MENTKSSWISWVVGLVVVIGLGYLMFTQKPVTAPSVDPEGVANTVGTSTQPKDEIAIGYVGPLTGNSSALGLSSQKAAQLAIEEINAKGGVFGKPLALKSEDGKCTSDDAAAALQKLVDTDRITTVIGGGCSSEVLGMAPMANNARVVSISYAATSPDVATRGGDYVFRLSQSSALSGKVAARYAVDKLKAKKIAVLSEEGLDASAQSKAFTDIVKTNKVPVVFEKTFSSTTTDFQAVAVSLAKSGADLVYLVPQSSVTGLAALRGLKGEAGTPTILTTEVLMSPTIIARNGQSFEKVIGVESSFNANNDAVSAFVSTYSAKYAEEPSYPAAAANAYSAVYLLKDQMLAQGNDAEKIKQALSTLTKWTGGTLKDVTLDSQGDVNWTTFFIQQVKDGKLINLEVYNI